MEKTRYLLVFNNDRVTISGYDTGSQSGHVWKRRGGHVVVKWPGRYYWSGQGAQSYAPAHFVVYEEVKNGPEHYDNSVWCHKVVEFDVKKSD